MANLTELISAWGYIAIFLVMILGNFGLPVPEETILTVGGYLAWQGQLRFSGVVAVGIVSAVVSDNMAYWLGRRYGRRLLRRWTPATPTHLERMQRLVMRYGALAVFLGRFVAGLRFMAGPLAGITGLGAGRFFVANLLGALAYVPVMVGVGYAIGYGLGDQIERLRGAAGDILLVALGVAVAIAWVVVAVRLRRRRVERG
jgi:membrane protein DedA with SNARE-associated domain